MTKALFNYLDDNFVSFEISGHSDFAEYGEDIVCSAITTATFYTIGLFNKFFSNLFTYIEKDGYIKLETNEEINQELVKPIIENFIEVLDNIQKQYPKNLKINIAKK